MEAGAGAGLQAWVRETMGLGRVLKMIFFWITAVTTCSRVCPIQHRLSSVQLGQSAKGAGTVSGDGGVEDGEGLVKGGDGAGEEVVAEDEVRRPVFPKGQMPDALPGEAACQLRTLGQHHPEEEHGGPSSWRVSRDPCSSTRAHSLSFPSPPKSTFITSCIMALSCKTQ